MLTLYTLIGTPPNLVFAAFIKETYGTEISFWQWFKFGLPIAIPLLIIGWLYLTRIAFKINRIKLTGGKKEITKQLNALGSIGKEEKHVLIVFVATAFAWITRSFILQKINPFIDDSIIALIAGVSLFIIYSKKSQKPLLSWEEAVQIPWGIIILFGGGMALAAGFESSGLALWLGQQMEVFKGLPFFLMILLTITLVNFITEVTSNLATIAMLLPILAPIALTLQIDPYTIMIAATVAASCAFMLPVATPPNAVVFGSGLLKISDMMRAGIWMNLISIIVLSIMVYFFLPLIWNV